MGGCSVEYSGWPFAIECYSVNALLLHVSKTKRLPFVLRNKQIPSIGAVVQW